jgi:hypothetical protein
VIATLAHNLLRWIAAIGLGARQELVVAKTLRRTLLPYPGGSSARPAGWCCICPSAGRGRRGLSWHWAGCAASPTPSDPRCRSTHDSRPISGQRERARKAASEPAAAYDRIRPVDTAPDEAVSPQTSLLRPTQPHPNPSRIPDRWIQALEEVRQLRAEGLSLPGDRRPGRLPLDPGPADPLRREAAAGVTSPTACLQCSADRTAGALEHGSLDGSFQSGQAPQW